MAICCNPYRGFRYPAEVIQDAVWLYHCFSLSLREVEAILAARGVVVSYESIREWGLRFGRLFANTLKRRRPKPGDKCISTRCSSSIGKLLEGRACWATRQTARRFMPFSGRTSPAASSERPCAGASVLDSGH